MKDRHLFAGLVRLHILHHASHGGVFSVGLMEELGHHGYKLSAGTLYPLLHSMEKSGLLISQTELENGRKRRVYEAIQTGKEVLRLGKDRVRELYGNCLRKRSDSRAAPSQSGLPPVNRSPMLTILALNRVRIRRRYGPA